MEKITDKQDCLYIFPGNAVTSNVKHKQQKEAVNNWVIKKSARQSN